MWISRVIHQNGRRVLEHAPDQLEKHIPGEQEMSHRMRSGGAVNLHLHFHTLVLDGVFAPAADGTLQFHPAPPPTDADVQWVVARVRRRLARLGVTETAGHDADPDPLAEESALAGLAEAAVGGPRSAGPSRPPWPAPGRRRPGRPMGRPPRAAPRAGRGLRPPGRGARRRGPPGAEGAIT